jgi:protein involved in polysaccharide export with SLBB domain
MGLIVMRILWTLLILILGCCDTALCHQEFIIVGGAVQRPGRVSYNSKLTLREAIKDAGGLAPGNNGTFRFIRRDGTVTQHKIRIILSNPQRIKLSAGDVIEVLGEF